MALVTINDIGWSRYLNFEGPFFGGRVLYVLPHGATFDDKVMAVVTETEGGRFDAVNMYDSCIMTVGAVQWCDRGMFGVCELLGYLAKMAPHVLNALDPAMQLSNARMTADSKGRFRFEFKDARGLVDTEDEQRQLYFGGAHIGKMGSWGPREKMHAKTWAASMANLWTDPRACDAQTKYTTARLVSWYAWGTAKKVLWDGGEAPDGYVGAMRAAYISYAANMPGIALKHFEIGLRATTAPKWSRPWCEDILKEMVFGPKIAIYPGRYNKIRPVIERVFGVDLTDTALQLTGFVVADTREVQEMLIKLGYDIGPSGADGIVGKKTKAAIVLFQSMNGLVPDGVVGPMTIAKMRAMVPTT